jgi:hypothetical protein
MRRGKRHPSMMLSVIAACAALIVPMPITPRFHRSLHVARASAQRLFLD